MMYYIFINKGDTMENKIEKSEEFIYLKIPKSLEENLYIKDSKIKSVLTQEGLIMSTKQSNKKQTIPLRGIILSSLIFVFVLLLVFKDTKQIPLTGSNSIASWVIIVGAITGMLSFTLVFTKAKKHFNELSVSRIQWRNYPVILFSHTVMLVLILLIIFWIIGQFFKGASFDHFTASLIGGVIVGVLNYMMVTLAINLTPRSLINTLIFIILGGVSIAMVTNSEHQWWLYNLSFLGTPEATNAWQFNATLIVSALLMIALIDYIFVMLKEIYGSLERLKVLKLLLVLTAICLGGVGFFPYNSNPFYQSMHNRVAGYLVYLFIILIVLIKWLLPNVNKDFLKLSYTVGVLLILSVLLFQGINYLSLTAFEIVAFVLAFSWLLILLKILIDMIQNNGTVHYLEILDK